jgi:predicted transcriptional regulator
MQQEILTASMEAVRMGLGEREARNYVAKCLHQLMKEYGVRKVNNRYEKVEIPMSSLYFGGEENEMV